MVWSGSRFKSFLRFVVFAENCVQKVTMGIPELYLSRLFIMFARFLFIIVALVDSRKALWCLSCSTLGPWAAFRTISSLHPKRSRATLANTSSAFVILEMLLGACLR